MGHKKLIKFAQNETFKCLLQPSAEELLADGYFNLLPGESRVITFSTPFHRGKVTLKAEGYNL